MKTIYTTFSQTITATTTLTTCSSNIPSILACQQPFLVERTTSVTNEGQISAVHVVLTRSYHCMKCITKSEFS